MMSPSEKNGRIRRKSRFGCRNCKLRKLKCDETRPHCGRCRTYGVLCNFSFDVPDLQPLSEKRPKQEITTSPCGLLSPMAALSNAVWVDDGSTFLSLDLNDQGLFNRFRYRTLYTLGGKAMVDVYENYILKMTFTNPFLMHGTLAVTAVHDRYLGLTPNNRRSLRELYHWSRCTTLLNKSLNQPIKEEHKDPIWAAAGTQAILTFSSINICLPEETWPLGNPDYSGLEWIRLGTGKMALWQLVNPLRPESVFVGMADIFQSMHQSLPTKGIDGIPIELVNVCGLNDSSTRESSPYFMVAHGLSHLLNMPKDKAPQEKALMVAGKMHGDFQLSLEKKDPIALLLLCLWYAKARESKWWIDIRARYEIPAICSYLQRFHEDNSAIQALIPWEELRRL